MLNKWIKTKKGKEVKMSKAEIAHEQKRRKISQINSIKRIQKDRVEFDGANYSCKKEDILHYQILIACLNKSTEKISVNDIKGVGKDLTKSKLIKLFRKLTDKYLENLNK